MTGPSLGRAGDRFVADYAALGEDPRLGEVAILPWDAEIFGFQVADYRPGHIRAADARALAERPEELARRLRAWADSEAVELVGCRISAGPFGAILEAAGFRFVEVQYQATIPRLRAADLRPARLTVRTAEPADHRGVSAIAGSAFALGRYHADPRFPRDLADRRYRLWVDRALAEPGPGAFVGVIGPPGSPQGFLYAEIADGAADIRLAAVRPEAGVAGPELFRGALAALASRNVSKVTARISAVNVAVSNIYAALGFRFHDPEIVLHWHRPASSRLVSLVRALEQGEGTNGQERSR